MADLPQSGSTSTKIDLSDPLYLHASDHPGMIIAPKFSGENFGTWKHNVFLSLRAKNKLGFIKGTLEKPDPGDDKAGYWERADSMVSAWIITALDQNIGDSLLLSANSADLWKNLCARYDRTNGVQLLSIKREIAHTYQAGDSIATYFTRIKKLWDEFSILFNVGTCKCKEGEELRKLRENERLVEFLMGLDESYHSVRGNLLVMDPLPNIERAYSLLIQEEKQRELTQNQKGNSDAMVFAANGNAQSNPRWQNNNHGGGNNGNGGAENNRPRQKTVCSFCDKPGHSRERCYKLIGYPNGYKFGKNRKNNNSSSINACTGDVATGGADRKEQNISPVTGFSNEQLTQLTAYLARINQAENSNSYCSFAGKQPLFSFGVISDVQYADIPDGQSFLGTPRYYRHSMDVLQRAVQKWNEKGKLSFAMNFGDTVDGKCPKDQSLNAVKKVVSVFDKFDGPVYHLIGNHCLYNLPRNDILPLLSITEQNDGCAYYDFSLAPGYRFVVLDGYDISAVGWQSDHPNTIKALEFLSEKNPNTNKNSPNGLTGPDRRFVMFNGAIGKEQLTWLEGVLCDATQLNQKVIVSCHLPLGPSSSNFSSHLWNYDEVMEVIHKYKCVKVCFSGHDHNGSYSIDSYGVHHRVFEAALECPPGSDAFGYVDVFEDRLSLIGTDLLKSNEMVFDS